MVFLALTFGAPLEPEEVRKVNRALLARETGWTYRHIDEEMDFQEVEETLAIFSAVDRAKAWLAERANRPTPSRARRR